MLVIRLARGGRTKYPVYRIVAAESARAATGKFIEVLGHYNPHTKELVIKKEETLKRLSHGAQPSNSVVKLLQRENMELPNWVKLKTKEPKKTDEQVEAEAAVEANETPAEEDTAVEEPAETPTAEASEAVASEGTETKVNEENPERVAVAATENTTDDSDESTNLTETATETDAMAEAAKKTEKAGDVAIEEATKDTDKT